jgi:cell division protein FtsL
VSALVAVAPLAVACLVMGVLAAVGTVWVGYWTRQVDRQAAAVTRR